MRPDRDLAVVTALPEELAPLLARASGVRRLRLPAPDLRAYTGLLGGRAVVLAATGDGPARAERGMRELLTRTGVSGWIGGGLAAALSPGVAPGTILVARSVAGTDDEAVVAGPDSGLDRDWVERALELGGARPARLRSVTRIAATPADKMMLRELDPASTAAGSADEVFAVDMESHAWLRAAAAVSAWSAAPDSLASSVPSASSRVRALVVRVVSDSLEEVIPGYIAEAPREDGSIDRRRIVVHALRHPSAVGKLLAMRRRALFCSERLADFVVRLLSRDGAVS